VTLNWNPEPRIRVLLWVLFTVLCHRKAHPVVFVGATFLGGGDDEFV